jgi:hypothetical protein
VWYCCLSVHPRVWVVFRVWFCSQTRHCEFSDTASYAFTDYISYYLPSSVDSPESIGVQYCANKNALCRWLGFKWFYPFSMMVVAIAYLMRRLILLPVHCDFSGGRNPIYQHTSEDPSVFQWVLACIHRFPIRRKFLDFFNLLFVLFCLSLSLFNSLHYLSFSILKLKNKLVYINLEAHIWHFTHCRM